MRVCLLGNSGSSFIRKWVWFFEESGIDTHVISLQPPAEPAKKVHHYAWRPWLGKLNYLYRVPSIKRKVAELSPHIVHGHYISSYGFLASLTGRRPLVLSAWGTDVLVVPKNSLILRQFVKHALRQADLVTAECSSTAQCVVGEFGVPLERAVVLPWGVDLRIFGQNRADAAKRLRKELGIPEGFVVVMSGRSLAPFYGSETLLEAIPPLLVKHPKTAFIILRGNAEPNYFCDFRKRIEAKGVAQRVVLIDRWLTPEELSVALQASDIFLSLPSSDSDSTTLNEALASGLIPIVSDNASNREVFRDGENGFLVPVSDVDSLARRVSGVIEGLPELKLRMADQNRNYIVRLRNWERNAARMIELYKGLLS